VEARSQENGQNSVNACLYWIEVNKLIFEKLELTDRFESSRFYNLNLGGINKKYRIVSCVFYFDLPLPESEIVTRF